MISSSKVKWRLQDLFTGGWAQEKEGLLFKRLGRIQLLTKNCKVWVALSVENLRRLQAKVLVCTYSSPWIFTECSWRKIGERLEKASLNGARLEEKSRHHSQRNNASHLHSSCLWIKSPNSPQERETNPWPSRLKKRRGKIISTSGWGNATLSIYH